MVAMLALAATSCSDWLDVNTDPDNATNKSASVDSRLAPMQHFLQYSYETGGVRAAYINQTLTRNYFSGNSLSNLSSWNPIQVATTISYQTFFVGCAANIEDMIEKATAEEAWHYVGAAKFIYAWGFMNMLDIYGEMPMSEALGSALNPKYDDGQTIYTQCVAAMKEAIEYLSMAQGAGATPLSAGDIWMDGDTNKWIKAAYGFLARWANNLSKKSSLYNPTEILDYLSKAAQSNAESFSMKHYNTTGDVSTDVLIGDPLMASILYDNTGWNDFPRLCKWYVDLLENMRGEGVEDPRANRLVPMMEILKADGTYELVRSKGADLTTDIRLTTKGGGPLMFSVQKVDKKFRWYYDETVEKAEAGSTYYDRKADSMICNLHSLGFHTAKTQTNDTYVVNDRIACTGTFYTRADAPAHYMCYPELCFIKAEVLFRQGDKGGALTAYKNGIRAHMELMNMHLAERSDATSTITVDNKGEATQRTVVNVSKTPMSTADIDAYLASKAVAQSAGDLKMSDIMLQKYIACSYSLTNWNDMRRFNYSAGNIADFGVVYPNFDRPYEFNHGNNSEKAKTHFPSNDPKDEDGYWFRRFMQCSHEHNFNAVQLKASNPRAADDDIWSMPVWWDIAE